MLKLYAHSSCRRMATCTIRLQNSTSDIGNTHFNRDRKDMKKQVKVTDYHRRAERTPLKAPTMLDAAKQLGLVLIIYSLLSFLVVFILNLLHVSCICQ